VLKLIRRLLAGGGRIDKGRLKKAQEKRGGVGVGCWVLDLTRRNHTGKQEPEKRIAGRTSPKSNHLVRLSQKIAEKGSTHIEPYGRVEIGPRQEKRVEKSSIPLPKNPCSSKRK